MSKVVDLVGQKFGRLLVLERSGSNKHGWALWKCLCDCGNHSIVIGHYLRLGNTKSCGCLFLETIAEGARKHDMSATSEYRSYTGAKQRCTNPRIKRYEDYGGRGIKFLYADFVQFFVDLGPKPSPEYSLDRINNDGNYEPGNCRWATDKEQVFNRRMKNLVDFSVPELLNELCRRSEGVVA